MDAFLSRDERRQIQRMFETWNKYLQGDDLLLRFYSDGILTDRDRAEYASRSTSFDKNEYLFDNLLMRATYDQVNKVKRILVESGISAHLELASMIPVRQPKPPPAPHQSRNYQNRAPPSSHNGDGDHGHQPMDEDDISIEESTPNERTRNPYSHTTNDLHHPKERPHETTKTQNQSSKQNEKPTPKANNSQAPPTSNTQAPPPQSNSQSAPSTQNDAPDHVPFMADRYDIKTEQYKQHVKPTQNSQPSAEPYGHVRNPVPNVQTVPDPRQENPEIGTRLHRYRVKGQGKGLCVIIANFTNDLKGYENDIEDITGFFQDKLKYHVMGGKGDPHEYLFRDLSTDQFNHKLREVQRFINDKSNNVDRLFMFVLSHGDEFGIKTRPIDRQDNSVRDRMKTDKIVDMFTHNHVPELKGLPKCFFVQVCRGVEVARAANRSAATPGREAMDTDEANDFEKPKIVALGADTLVCHAAKEGKYSWVVDTKMNQKGGSWFLQATMDVFGEHHQHEHVLDMMTEVNRRVSEKQGKAEVALRGDTQKRVVSAYQLPAVCNNLTRKLYL